MTNTNKAPGPRRRVLSLLAAVFAAAALLVFWPSDRRDESPQSGAPFAPGSASETVPAAAASDALPGVGEPGRLPPVAIRDLELAMEAALAEQRAAEDAVRRAEAAMLDVEEQLDLRVEQGEDPDDLEAEAVVMLDGVFVNMQAALRRLDQADASIEMLEEQLAQARSGRGASD